MSHVPNILTHEDLKISINYLNHVLLVIFRRMGTFKNVFIRLIVQIPPCTFCQKNETQPDMFVKGVTST